MTKEASLSKQDEMLLRDELEKLVAKYECFPRDYKVPLKDIITDLRTRLLAAAPSPSGEPQSDWEHAKAREKLAFDISENALKRQASGEQRWAAMLMLDINEALEKAAAPRDGNEPVELRETVKDVARRLGPGHWATQRLEAALARTPARVRLQATPGKLSESE